jgi:DoxX-like protein
MSNVASIGVTADPRGRTDLIRPVAYWLFTLVLSYEIVASGVWGLLRVEYVSVIRTQLGYPPYFGSILAVWAFPCALAVLLPRFPRLKEWAYAGLFFKYTGAAASLILVGDGASQWVLPLIFAGFPLASWGLRPQTRRLTPANAAAETRVLEWIVPILIAVLLLVLALVTIPKGSMP